MSAWVWLNEGLVPRETASTGADDRGLLLGDGVFETCKVLAGQPFALRRHLERLRLSASLMAIDLPWTDEQLRDICVEVIRANGTATGSHWEDPRGGSVEAPGPGRAVGSGGGAGPAIGAGSDDVGEPEPQPEPAGEAVGRLRITVTRGSTPPGAGGPVVEPLLLVTASPAPPHRDSADVVTVSWPVNERSPVAGAKTTSRAESVMVLEHALRAGADEAVQANTVGALCEGTTSNVFLVVDGRLCTPALSTGCLAGVTRALVCETVDVEERDDLTLDHLRSAPEAFLSSSTRDVLPIARVDGEPLRSTPGPLTRAAATAFAALVARTLDP